MEKTFKAVLHESKGTIIFIIVLFSLLLRYGVSLNPYSGDKTPPMFGDYEAQRHWMEITFHLPVNEWYEESPNNDLLYWGLDYPPLTAYHSYICGFISHLLNPNWVALNTSRGFEGYEHKLFMRFTVIAADLLLYIPAVIMFFYQTSGGERYTVKQLSAISVVLCYPGLILIDHGHFQYNSVSLGFVVISVAWLLNDCHVVGSLFFVFALNYKQMELYHALPFFFYLLGICLKQKSWFGALVKLFSIGIMVIIGFIICWLPFLHSFDSAVAVLKRLFPFNRGLFEDKVANVWCSVSVVFKLKKLFTQQQMVYVCLVTTLLSCLPSCINLFIYPTKKKFLYSLINCSLSFFLFSYQVHEKSILIVALPVCLVLLDSSFINVWFLAISTISMYPLLVIDGQSMAYFSLLPLFLVTCYVLLDLKNGDFKLKLLVSLSLVACVFLHAGYALIPAPSHLPDLYPLLFSVYSCTHLLLFLSYFNFKQFYCPTYDVGVDELFVESTKSKVH